MRSSGHFPHLDEPERFVEVLDDFIASTEPAAVDPAKLRRRLQAGGGGPAGGDGAQ